MRLGIAKLCDCVYDPNMNWKNLIEDLLQAGFNQSSISREIGLTQPTVFRILNGEQKDMKWSDGERLLALHRATVRTPNSNTPEVV
jgi:hypothetical protein